MKRSAAFIVPVVLFAMLSCSSPEQSGTTSSLPSDSVIPEKKMISLLVDVHLLEGGLTLQKNKGQQDRKWSQEAYRKLFIKYNVRQGQFIRNMAYYQKDPENYTKIYDSVLKRIDKLKALPSVKKK